MLEVLECIEKAFPTNKECNGNHASEKARDTSKKKMAAFSERIPKKRCVDAKP
jgi:hypothetical protein